MCFIMEFLTAVWQMELEEGQNDRKPMKWTKGEMMRVRASAEGMGVERTGCDGKV